MPRKFHEYPIYFAVDLLTKSLGFAYRVKNHSAKKLLFYTDSRGFEISKSRNKKNPFSSYVGYFIKRYKVDFDIYPKKHTTILDFLDAYRGKYHFYDLIILHAGIVDFSPRPKSALERIYETKGALLTQFIPRQELERNLQETFYDSYEGEATASLYSLESARNHVLPRLQEIPNVLWIGSNKVLPNWQGSYPKPRPRSMYIIDQYCQMFAQGLNDTINLQALDEKDIMRLTVDNIHLSQAGFDYLKKEIEKRVLAL